jgi:hypothetical protein
MAHGPHAGNCWSRLKLKLDRSSYYAIYVVNDKYTLTCLLSTLNFRVLSLLAIGKLEYIAFSFSVTSELRRNTQNLRTMEVRTQDVHKICSVLTRFVRVWRWYIIEQNKCEGDDTRLKFVSIQLHVWRPLRCGRYGDDIHIGRILVFRI